MSIISPAGTGMGFLPRLIFFPTPHTPLVQFQHMAPANRQWKNKMRIAEGFFFLMVVFSFFVMGFPSAT